MRKYAVPERKVSLGGPVVDTLENPYSDKGDIIYVGPRRYDDPLLDPLHGVKEPGIEDSWVARKASLYVRRIIRSLNRQIAKEGGVKLRYRDLRIRAMREPHAYVCEGGSSGPVLGYYDTRTKEIFLNPYLTEEGVREVTAHEIVHYAQDKLGIIGRYVERYGERSRAAIERQAEDTTKAIMPDLFLRGRARRLDRATA
jgi:Zn-dependent peptidase ImmA (M78 family)